MNAFHNDPDGTISRSYPYLHISRLYDLDYGTVLAFAEAGGTAAYMNSRQRSSALVLMYGYMDRDERLMSASNIADAQRHFRFVQKYGIHNKDEYDRLHYDEIPEDEWPVVLPGSDDIPF